MRKIWVIHRKFTLKVKLWHFLTPPHYTNSENSIIFCECIDSYFLGKNLSNFVHPSIENPATHITITIRRILCSYGGYYLFIPICNYIIFFLCYITIDFICVSGDHPRWCNISQWPLASWMFYLHSLHKVPGWSKIYFQVLKIIFKGEKIWEDSLDLILSPSASVKIWIIGRKVYLR